MAGINGKLQCLVVIMVASSIINCYFVSSDPDSLQDVCVADLASDVMANGFPCKPGFNASDFFFAGLANPGTTPTIFGSQVTRAFVTQLPGLNTLGVAIARVDFAPGGINPPHSHPRATEIFFMLYGEVDVTFITPTNVAVSTTVKPGDVFAIPKGFIHFEINKGKDPAAFINAFNSQNPGVQTTSLTLFNSTPPVPSQVLAMAFQISIEAVDTIKSKLAPMN